MMGVRQLFKGMLIRKTNHNLKKKKENGETNECITFSSTDRKLLVGELTKVANKSSVRLTKVQKSAANIVKLF